MNPSRSEFCNNALTWHYFVPPEERDRFIEHEWPELAATGIWRGALTGLHSDGHLIEQAVTLTRTDDGGVLCFARDITEQRAMQIEREKLREDLQIAQRRETIAQLASGVAHDLNNLVAVVSGTVCLLEKHCAGNPEVCKALTRIARAMDAARNLVTVLGRSTRLNAPRKVLDLRDVAIEAIDLLGSERSKRHAIRAALPNTAEPVWANHTELLQVILNLTLNACEAVPDGSCGISLVVGADMRQRKPEIGELDPDAAYSVFEVIDTGAGLDPAVRDTLFESYVTTKGDIGTGMGLAIVAGILRDNSGALWFDSVPGEGVTVTVAWPEVEKASQALPLQGPVNAALQNLAGHSILLIDDVSDVSDVADVLSEMLERDGAVCIAVSDANEALQLLAENPGLWSAVVTDLSMHEISGTDIARAAAKLVPPVPCVLVTALPERAAKDRDLFQNILAKPVEAVSLRNHFATPVTARVNTFTKHL